MLSGANAVTAARTTSGLLLQQFVFAEHSGPDVSTTLFPPASHSSFSFAPTMCVNTWKTARTNVVALADGIPFASVTNGSSDLTFTAWTQMANVTLASKPDCAGISDGTVHVVALDSRGHVVWIHGDAGHYTVETFPGYVP